MVVSDDGEVRDGMPRDRLGARAKLAMVATRRHSQTENERLGVKILQEIWLGVHERKVGWREKLSHNSLFAIVVIFRHLQLAIQSVGLYVGKTVEPS